MNNTGLQQSSGLVILTLEVHSGEKSLHCAMHTMRTSAAAQWRKVHWCTVCCCVRQCTLVHSLGEQIGAQSAAYGNAFLFLSAAAAAASGGSGTQWMH